MPPLIAGLIVAGGAATRLGGGDKLLVAIGGVTILDRIVAALEPQCDPLILNANGDPARFAPARLPVVADDIAGRQGPLAGVLAGLDWLALNAPSATFALAVPSDTPFLPPDLLVRLRERREAERATLVHATSGGRAHVTVALWPVTLRDDLRHAVVDKGVRKVGAFFETQKVARVDWAIDPFDRFFNVNTPEDRAAAEAIVARPAR